MGVIIVDSLNANTEVQQLSPDNIYFFTWVVDCPCGITTETVFVNISDPSVSAGANFIVCDETNSTVLAGEVPAMGSLIQWYSLDPDILISEGETPTPTITGLKVGNNAFVLEVDEGFCGAASRDTVIVTYKLPPVLNDDTFDVAFGATEDVYP
ncbi:MAG: hypothetical protein R2795_15100 [Saprospiraceae bacterium]